MGIWQSTKDLTIRADEIRSDVLILFQCVTDSKGGPGGFPPRSHAKKDVASFESF